MLLFIALPVVSVIIQSLYVEHDKVFVEVENCDPFSCKMELQIDFEATKAIQESEPLGAFNGLGTYTNRNHLAVAEIAEAWRQADSLGAFVAAVGNYPFYKALGFTLTYTFVVTPMVILLGFLIALAVNAVAKWMKGIVIFVSLLPMIITPLIGSLVLFWMIDSDGVIGSLLKFVFDDPGLSLKASPFLTWIMLMVYGVWHSSPFAFIVLYAGLQTVTHETVEAAKVDGANRWEIVRYVVIPHLMPLVVFISLIQLMDNFRVFEPIVGFNAEASATSLSWIIYNDLRVFGSAPLFGSAAATSVLTIIGVSILLFPVLLRTWREHKRG